MFPCPPMAIEPPSYLESQSQGNNNSPALIQPSSSSDTTTMRPNLPSAPSAPAPCTVSSSSCTNAHETIISIDRVGVMRSASLRRVVPIDHTATTTAALASLPAATPPVLPTRSPPGGTYGTSSRRLRLLSSGFWVSVELFFTLSQILAAIVVLAVSQTERPETPLPVWVIGYAVGCSATLPLLYWRYHNHPPMDNLLDQGPTLHHHQSTPWPASTSMPISYPGVSHHDPHDPIGGRVHQGIPRGYSIRVELFMERLRMTLDCFFAVWFVLGNVWVFGRPSAAQESPKLYRLCVAFLALSCVSYAMPFVVCAAVCCCLPCLISVLGFGEGSGGGHGEGCRGASADTIADLPVFRFRSKRCATKIKKQEQAEEGQLKLPEKGSSYKSVDCCCSSSSDNDCSSEGGVMAAGTQHERFIAGDDAACCICLGRYKDNAQLRGLPCLHHFHVECLDQWLKINASCPLCKFSLQGGKNGDGDGEDSSTSARRGRRLFEEV